MTFEIRFNSQSMSGKFRARVVADKSRVAQAITGAARLSALEIKRQGDLDIKAAGKFGRRWQDAFKVEVTPKTGALLNARIDVSHTIPYSNVFETGGTIKGNPLLWIPLSYTGLTMRARDYARSFGGLFYVRRHSGAPLLLSIRDHMPKYFGVSSVTIKKKFHIHEITRSVMRNYRSLYSRLMKRA